MNSCGSGSHGAQTHDAGSTPEDRVVAALVANHRAFLGFLEARVEDRGVAEDILQAAFAKGIERADTVRDEEAAVAWFYRTLRNAVIDHYRRRGARTRGLEAFSTQLERSQEPDAELASAACQCVLQLADTLKPSYANALRRIEVDGLPVKDFAEEQGISASNAAVRVFRARQALKQQVVRSCGTCADHGCLECSCGSPRPQG